VRFLIYRRQSGFHVASSVFKGTMGTERLAVGFIITPPFFENVIFVALGRCGADAETGARCCL
jgi:hypothetical protein